MSPAQYARAYSNLRVSDTRMGLNFTTAIWMYISGKTGGKELRTKEYNSVLSLIAKHLKLPGPSSVPDTFFLKGHDMFDPAEPFYKQGLRRAYAGRGSMDEMVDATRLAWAFKRCEPFTAAKYAQGWFGQDCNAFVGNYQGISPNVSIAAYAKGYSISEEKAEDFEGIKGATKCVYLSVPYLPLPVITDPTNVRRGSVIVTYGGGEFKHIALVESFHFNPGSKPTADIEIAEWGEAGDETKHAKPSVRVNLDLAAKIAPMGNKKLIGWSQDEGKLRFLLDASPLDEFGHRGWHVCNHEGY